MTVNGFDQYNGNPEVDYTVAKKEGLAFLIHKATEGYTYTDPKFKERAQAAKAAGLLVGGYCFGRPDGSTPEQEVDHLMQVLNEAGIHDFPLILDIEREGSADLHAWVLRWLQVAREKSGRLPLLYASPNFIRTHNLASSDIQSTCDLWIANYGVGSPDTAGYPSYKFWQNSDQATIAGSGELCSDEFNGDLAALESYLGAKAAPVSASPAPVAPPVLHPDTYVVASGDTLSAIALRFHTSVEVLAQINGIANPNLIDVGQVLKLSDNNAAAAPAPSAIGPGIVHFVQPGETLSGIGGRYNVPYSVIAKWNHIANPNVIQAGQKLIIPQAHRVRPNETLSGLVGSAWPDVAAANGINPNLIFVGQTLYI